MNKEYAVKLELSGPTALWARRGTMPNPVSWVCRTYRGTKGPFEAALRRKTTPHYPGSESGFRSGAALCANGCGIIPPLVETGFVRPDGRSGN